MEKDDENLNQNLYGDSLKSLLKKPGIKGKSSNRVVFNENKNEFFDADYIILIREECEYDDDDEDEICTCSEMVSHVCCEPNCGCNIYNLHEQTPQSPKFPPPIEFVDTVTLSPPEGYKDMELDDKQIIAIQELASNSPKVAVCRECIANQKEIDQDSEEVEILGRQLNKQTNLQKLKEDEFHVMAPPVSGILKGGLLWNQGIDLVNDFENAHNRKLKLALDKERAVRFIDNGEELHLYNQDEKENCLQLDTKENNGISRLSSQETAEMLLTFKFGNHILISNNSLKPNSAVRQLFPDTNTKKFENKSKEFIVNTETLQTFDETVSQLPKIIQRCESRTIKHSTFRHSFVRYEPKTKKTIKKDDNSLIERIKLLTCDLDENNINVNDISERISPAGEESYEIQELNNSKPHVKNSSPTSSTSSNSSSISSTYKKLTDLFVKKEKNIEMTITDENNQTPSELSESQIHILNKTQAKFNIIENKKQLLTTLVPLTACVNGNNANEYYYDMNNDFANRTVSCSTNTEYLIDDTKEITVNGEDTKVITPDVLAGTPTIKNIGELSVLMQQDVVGGIKIKCHPEYQLTEEDDENDDYGFNRRPSVQGVKQKFDASTEILNQIQNHLEDSDPNTRLTWPYYSQNSFRENNQNLSKIVPEGKHSRVFSWQRPFKHDSSYQNHYNKQIMKGTYNSNIDTNSAVIGIEVDYNEYYLPQIMNRNNRPLSPPPQDFTRNYHTMVYIPYNRIEGCRPFISPNQLYHENEILKPNNPSPQNKMYDEFYQQKMYPTDGSSASNILPVLTHRPSNTYLRPDQTNLSTCISSESSLITQTSVKSTQTLSTPLLACSYFHNNKNKSPIEKIFGNCNSSRHNLSSSKNRFPKQINSEDMLLEESNFNSANSSTKLKFMERGVPEGADSLSPVASIRLDSSSNIVTSPSFYAMNV